MGNEPSRGGVAKDRPRTAATSLDGSLVSRSGVVGSAASIATQPTTTTMTNAATHVQKSPSLSLPSKGNTNTTTMSIPTPSNNARPEGEARGGSNSNNNNNLRHSTSSASVPMHIGSPRPSGPGAGNAYHAQSLSHSLRLSSTGRVAPGRPTAAGAPPPPLPTAANATLVDPALSSVPRYVDESSVVYTPITASGVYEGNERGLEQSLSLSQQGLSRLRAGAETSQYNLLISSPCTPSRGVFPTSAAHAAAPLPPPPPLPPMVLPASPVSNLGSAPIAIPTYNSHNQIAEEMECSSPMLKSYRHSSLSRRENVPVPPSLAGPHSPPSHVLGFAASAIPTGTSAIVGPTAITPAVQGSFPFGQSVSLQLAGSIRAGANASGLAGTNGAGAGTSGSFSPAGGLAGASASNMNGGSAAAGGGGGGKAPRHTRFLEITGCPLGLENYGNTCYINSVLQLLYHCTPLRLRILELQEVYESRKGGAGFEDNTVLAHLCRLFALMHKTNNNAKKEQWRRSIPPLQFLNKVRAVHPEFNNDAQQDAHEFAMLVLNSIIDTEKRIMADPKNRLLFSENVKKRSAFAFWRSGNSSSKNKSSNSNGAAGAVGSPHAHQQPLMSATGVFSSTETSSRDGTTRPAPSEPLTPMQAIMQGLFVSLTACLECGHVSSRDEVFMDLSLETTQGSSLLRCLHHFGDPAFFYGSNKLRCEHCGQQVQAAKTMHVQQLPQYALLIHLKRFRYDTARQTFTKNSDHVAIPTEMDVEEYPNEEYDDRGLGSTQQTPLTLPMMTSSATKSGASEPAAEKEMSAEAKAERRRRIEAEEDAAGPPALSDALRRRLRGVARHKARFTLTGFVVHLGDGPNMGHYFTCIRYGPQLWRRFDDDIVSTMTEREVQQYFGVPLDATGMITTTAYMLLYERVA